MSRINIGPQQLGDALHTATTDELKIALRQQSVNQLNRIYAIINEIRDNQRLCQKHGPQTVVNQFYTNTLPGDEGLKILTLVLSCGDQLEYPVGNNPFLKF